MTSSRTITADEVRGWLRSPRNKDPDHGLCALVAERLTRMRWPDDGAGAEPDPTPPTLEDNAAFWDYQAAAEAVIILQNSLPDMARFFEGQQWAAETSAAYPALVALQEDLAVAVPYILHPFGEYPREIGRKSPKEWHLPAIMIANWVAPGIIPAGGKTRSLDRTSVAVRVVGGALKRMGYLGSISPPSDSALSQHLIRWRDKYGIEGFRAPDA